MDIQRRIERVEAALSAAAGGGDGAFVFEYTNALDGRRYRAVLRPLRRGRRLPNRITYFAFERNGQVRSEVYECKSREALK